jgi:hypothetical protein
MDQNSIAQAIQKELADEEQQLMDAQKKVQILSERVNANRSWLQAHGFPFKDNSESKNGTQPQKSDIDESTVKGAAVSILKMHKPLTITKLHELIVAAGKNVKRVTVDQAVRDSRYFELSKKDGRVLVSLKNK